VLAALAIPLFTFNLALPTKADNTNINALHFNVSLDIDFVIAIVIGGKKGVLLIIFELISNPIPETVARLTGATFLNFVGDSLEFILQNFVLL